VEINVPSDCLFCKLVTREIPGDIVYEDEDVLAFNDISPQAPTHILIIPKQHVATVNDVPEEQASLFGTLVGCAKRLAIQRGIDASGYRLIMNCNGEGGQTVFHVHLHLLGGRQLTGLG